LHSRSEKACLEHMSAAEVLVEETEVVGGPEEEAKDLAGVDLDLEVEAMVVVVADLEMEMEGVKEATEVA